MNLPEPIISVQPDKFLLDYKILIFTLAIIIISIIIANIKKSSRTAMLSLIASNVIIFFIYVYNRIYLTSELGYQYFIETNNDYSNLTIHIIAVTILFLIIFLSETVINRIKASCNE